MATAEERESERNDLERLLATRPTGTPEDIERRRGAVGRLRALARAEGEPLPDDAPPVRAATREPVPELQDDHDDSDDSDEEYYRSRERRRRIVLGAVAILLALAVALSGTLALAGSRVFVPEQSGPAPVELDS